ncbi:COPII coat assembly protein SEC16 [Diplocarpon rosae]|nr:COPII coat assembly protein SEC16 [Diplocarpon rosae]
MQSETAEASWHPAFRPNSTSKITAAKAPELMTSSQPTCEPAFEDQQEQVSPASRPAGLGASEKEEHTWDQTPSGNDAQSKLEKPQDAIAMSPASPAATGLGESLWQNGYENTAAAEIDKREIHSEGPHHENRHLSTMSFARTVSEEVNWGEDDEVDSQWNIRRTDTDPFKLMAGSDRTNSFPEVQHAPSPIFNPHDHSLPHSQAADIMAEVEKEISEDIFGNEENDAEAGFFAQNAMQLDDHQGFSHENGMDDDELRLPDYGQTYGGDVRPEQEKELEARFEEGLPLVQHEDEQSQSQPSAQLSNMDNHFATDDAIEEEFFAQVNNAEQELRDPIHAPPLERKSTLQVMDAINYQPHEQIHENILEGDDTEISQMSSARSTGVGIAASSSTIMSAASGGSDAPIQTQSGGTDEDLAARWEAALAGDELLADEDDELLPDDDGPTENTGFDPSTVFGSDDEGFLEDNDDQNAGNLFAQQTSPHFPAPAPGLNGHALGFDSVAGAVQPIRPTSSSSKYLPTGAATAAAPVPRNLYAPSGLQLTDISATSTPANVASPYMSPPVPNFQPRPARPEMPKAQSFADKSKGGYASPYDLPMEVVKPRKRVSMQQMNRPAQRPVDIAPPRSSSMYNPTTRGPTSNMSPNTSIHGSPSQLTPGTVSQPPKTTRKSESGFFEELPMSRPRPAARQSSSLASPGISPYGPPTPGAVPPPPAGPARSPYNVPSVQQNAMQHPIQPPQQTQGLVAPEKVSPYASIPSANIPTPAVASRYSPAPPAPQQSHTAPPPAVQSRYSPAPPSQRAGPYAPSQLNTQPPQTTPILAHLPRTSSPLAHFERNKDSRSRGHFSEAASLDRRTSHSGYEPGVRSQQLPPTREVEENGQFSPNSTRDYEDLQGQYSQQAQPPVARETATPPPPQGLASRLVNSPQKRATSNYLPQQTGHGPPEPFLPPKRSQTQSPGNGFSGPRLEMPASIPYQRPASVEVPPSPRNSNVYKSMSVSSGSGRPRGLSQGLSFVAPTDGRENDPLQRWRGSPVFVWGVGGTVMTSFPQDIPRYGMNSQAMVIRTPGAVKIRSIKDLDPLHERLSSFPGPLKGKSKKKEVLAWLASGIELLEQNASYLRTVSMLSHEDKRIEERILLWKILRVFIEHDGTLEGTPVVDKAVRSVLSPGLDEQASSDPLYATGAYLSGISQSSNTAPRADPVDPAAVDQLRRHLLRGDREKAVWDAVDKRLWSHAMLISNTVSKELYKKVAQEFIQKEVKIIGDNVEPLAALYEIFAGNFEESIDELVPLSARAGFQMVSTSSAIGLSKDAIDGLDRWRETLGLVLSNRSSDDSQALNALGKLLSGYGRAEAAHICFLFARSLSIFGGVDDPQASIVLVGSDQLRQPHDFDRELEPILLSEVFEYGISLSSTSTIAISSPHLAVYKLQHAKILAEYGFRDKALQYCEAVGTSITSQTRRSPYHHGLLVSELDDLSKRLKQSPRDETASWISKPSIDKAKGSVWATFNKFVAGDEADAAANGSNGAGAPDIGPFSRIAGGTPTISRSASVADIHAAYHGASNGTAPVPITRASSRYAPGASSYGNHEPPSSTSYGSQPRTSLEERSSSEFRRYEPQRQMSDYRPNSQPSNQGNSSTPQSASGLTPLSSYTPFGNSGSTYEPPSTYPHQTPLTEQNPPSMLSSPKPLNSFDGQPPSSYNPSEPSYGQSLASSFGPPAVNNYQSSSSNVYEPVASNSYEPPASSGYEAPQYDPQVGGYEPPSNGYAPPSYEPIAMNDEPDSPIDTRPKKKSFMDDDEDDLQAPGNAQAAPEIREKTKAEKDKEADEAFRKAAEADAQKSKDTAPAKKGWGLGGWFGGSKKETQDTGPAPNKPIKAKLGEASSFFYDPELKRWVNKKAGAEDTPAKSATPPPPRAPGPPRTASAPLHPPAAMIPPRPIPTGSGAPQMLAQRAVSDSSHMGFPPSPQSDDGSVGGLAAPPAINRSQSNGSLRSAPPSRPGTGMSNASSIDDLLGPAVPRKAGLTAKKGMKKKGRGYVDVMGDKAS